MLNLNCSEKGRHRNYGPHFTLGGDDYLGWPTAMEGRHMSSYNAGYRCCNFPNLMSEEEALESSHLLDKPEEERARRDLPGDKEGTGFMVKLRLQEKLCAFMLAFIRGEREKWRVATSSVGVLPALSGRNMCGTVSS